MDREEALKIVRENYPHFGTTEPWLDLEKALATLIPELAESEDERIREFLIDYFTSYKIGNVTTKLNGYRIDDILAYLEKQKEASKAIEAVEKMDKYIDENLANAHDMKDSNPDKKYYRGWDDALGEMARILQDVYSGEKQKEQKGESSKFELKTPEWVCRGWDDEYMINTVIGRYSLHAEVAKKRGDTHDYNLSKSMENWLRNVVKPLILEKQKEQKPAIKLVFPKFRVGDIIRNVHDESDKTTRRISYVGEHGYNFDYRHLGDKAGGGSFGFCCEDYYELVEQKPAEWSEEDEKMRQSIIKDIEFERNYTFATTGKTIEKYNEQINWLKSLSLNLKKKNEDVAKLCSNEWSEEDETRLTNTLIMLKEYAIHHYSKDDVEKSVDWLENRVKFFLSQYHGDVTMTEAYKMGKEAGEASHWKPSEEQMEALLKAEVFLRAGLHYDSAKTIAELYEQLKKL